MKCKVRIVVLALLAALAAGLAPRPAAAAMQAVAETRLEVHVDAAAAAAGGRVPVVAHLTRVTGEPVAQATVEFLLDGAHDGQAVTDASGDARWRLRATPDLGDHTV